MGKKMLNKKEERGEREKGRGKGRGVEEDMEGYIGGKERGVGKEIGRGRKGKGETKEKKGEGTD